jgi:cystathionine beta-lyase/cystathionine gamma-synthase
MENFDTTCVHPLKEDNFNGAVTSGIYPAVAYDYLDHKSLQYPGFYSTYNQQRLGQIICNLEKGKWGMVFSSGMAAISTAILSFVTNNDHIIFSKDLYGGTLKFANEELPKRGIRCSFANNTSESFRSLLQKNTKIIYIETPSNPLLSIISLTEIAAIAKAQNIITIIDNTFASPINQLPLSHGIDISVHSGTKYLGGHNDLPYGALVSNNINHKEIIYNTAKMYGGSLTPYECYMAERSLKTLALRINKQNENAEKVAQFLQNHSAIKQVYYPGLSSHPNHKIAAQQMKGFGGMVSFELNTDLNSIDTFQRNLQLISPALSLGGVESLICSPVFTSHRYLTRDERIAIGINDNLLRLSVGIENANDLINDLQQAIEKTLK